MQRSLVGYSALNSQIVGHDCAAMTFTRESHKGVKSRCLWKPLSKLRTVCIPGRVEFENFLCNLDLKALSFSLDFWDSRAAGVIPAKEHTEKGHLRPSMLKSWERHLELAP